MVYRSPDTALRSLIKSLPKKRTEKDALDALVKKTLKDTAVKFTPEIRKGQWELALKTEVLTHAMKEGKALQDPDTTTYYDELKDRLDIVLTFTEQDACEQTFPFTTLQDLLETQTIPSCSHIFSWIESRADRLTEGMVPQKGKALILLRMLNDLLRRLSKMGSNTIFCGRILTFLSGVFPLGERSGVNLRGEYGPVWEGVQVRSKEDKEKEKGKESGDKDEVMTDSKDEAKDGAKAGEEKKDQNAMEVDEKPDSGKPSSPAKPADKKNDKKEDFYETFWSLQLPFSRPPLFANAAALPEFKEAVNKVLPVIKEATAKERAMMGSRSGASVSNHLKRKREAEPGEDETGNKDYFFAKFLTSPDLLELEIADTHFRRQFIFQLLILLNHLLIFTKSEKAAWSSPRNRSLQIDFTLEPDDAKWVTDTIAKAQEELRQTAPGGRAFADTTHAILEREKNWIRWKNDLCAPFDREPYTVDVNGEKVGLEEATREVRKKMRVEPPEWEHRLGSGSLTDIWDMGYRSLQDLQNPFQPGEVKDFVTKVKQEDARIEMRRKALARAAAQAKARAAPPPPPVAAAAPQAEAIAAPVATAPSHEGTKVAANGPSGSPMLHPLPAKPGSSSKPSSSGGEPTPAPLPSAAAATPTPAPAASAAPAAVSAPAATPSPAPAPKLPPDDQIARFQENKHRWSWLALRTARDRYLAHFGKIGTGDITLLAQEIEKAAAREEQKRAEKDAKEAGGDAAMERPRVLVTGGAGYIGSHIVYSLQKTRRYKIISIDNYHNSHPEALSRLEQIARDALPANATADDKASTSIDVYKCDLTQVDQVRAVFEKYGKGGIWGVIHVAAWKAVGESTEIPVTYYHNNVTATIYLLQVMSDFDCNRLVYSSSATVYGTPPTIPIPESTRLQALSPYGKSKIMAETIIDDLVHAQPKTWRAISLRYFNPAGAHPSGLIGEDPLGRPGNLLPLLGQMAVGRVKDPVLQVFGNDYPTPDGTCVRDYLHVLDLADGHLLALDALTDESKVFDNVPDGVRYKAYNLGSGKGSSVLQIVEAMRKATGFDFKTEIVGRRRGDVPDLTADPALAEKELGFKVKQSLDTACRDLWNWQTKNPSGR
ncbi:UDP-glucose 4-epimerase [Dentipellis sp. KUC8613]|nr:UDP-glucose 4-epimerase [Dentipellis sp. KUC8613]